MTTRRWWLTGAGALIVAAAIVAAVLVWVSPTRSGSDCDIVHQLVAHNRAHNEAVTAQSNPDHPSEIPLADYQAWAAQLRSYAKDIHDPRIAPHADQVAALADQTVTLVGQSRDDTAQSPTSGPPPWVQQYAQLNAQFKKELSALEADCPT